MSEEGTDSDRLQLMRDALRSDLPTTHRRILNAEIKALATRITREEKIAAQKAVKARSAGICEVRFACHGRRVVQTHHVLKQADGGTWAEENLLGVCNACHIAIHSDEEYAIARGWLRAPNDRSETETS